MLMLHHRWCTTLVTLLQKEKSLQCSKAGNQRHASSESEQKVVAAAHVLEGLGRNLSREWELACCAEPSRGSRAPVADDASIVPLNYSYLHVSSNSEDVTTVWGEALADEGHTASVLTVQYRTATIGAFGVVDATSQLRVSLVVWFCAICSRRLARRHTVRGQVSRPKKSSSSMGASSTESYILALAWEPQRALDACPFGAAPNPLLIARMNELPSTVTALHSLSMHGLRPHSSVELRWPVFCDECDASAKSSGAGPAGKGSEEDCNLHSATLSTYNTSEEWQQAAPSYAWGSLALKEWRTHGHCSPFAQVDFFSNLNLASEELSAGDGAAAVSRGAAAGNISAAALRAAFRADTGAAPVLKCAFPPDSCALLEVHLGLAAHHATKRPLTSHGHGIELMHNNPAIDTEFDSCTSCETLRLASWRGCLPQPSPPLPPSMPAPPHSPPLPPRQPPPSSFYQLGSNATGGGGGSAGGAIAWSTIALLLLSFGCVLLVARMIRNRYFYAKLRNEQSNEQSRAAGHATPNPVAHASSALHSIESGVRWIVDRRPKEARTWQLPATELGSGGPPTPPAINTPPHSPYTDTHNDGATSRGLLPAEDYAPQQQSPLPSELGHHSAHAAEASAAGAGAVHRQRVISTRTDLPAEFVSIDHLVVDDSEIVD